MTRRAPDAAPQGSSVVTSTRADVGDRARYTEQQLVEILRRAAERQESETGETDGKFSLVEIQQIASEVGIAPAHVAAAAEELAVRRVARTGGALGAPTTFRFEQWLDGEIPTESIGDLFDIARDELEQPGQVNEVLDTVEWRARTALGAFAVSVTRRHGRTKIGVVLSRTDAAALGVIAATGGGLLGAAVIGAPLVVTAATVSPLAIAAAVAVSLGWAGGGSWLALRTAWRRVARPWAARADALGARLVAAAQRAIDDARKDTE